MKRPEPDEMVVVTTPWSGARRLAAIVPPRVAARYVDLYAGHKRATVH